MAATTITRRRYSEQTVGWLYAAVLSPVAAVGGWQIGKVLWFGVLGG